MNIRKAVETDVYALEVIEQEVFKHSLGHKFLYFEITENPFSYYLVYEESKQILGYIGLHIVDQYASVINFAVGKTFQRKGIGQKLLDYVLKHLRSQNVLTMSLEVRVSNQQAIAFYQKNGFAKSHVKPLYYEDEDGIVFIREVKS